MNAYFSTLLLLFSVTALTSQAITLDYKYSGVPINSGAEAKKVCPGTCKKADMDWQGTFSSRGLCLCQKNP
ncbi:TPA: hypothetical protein DDZ86_04135 [Candidatus Dependentiae bacterium]|nr:hypothetical protein [Candidatus Dependentiae bacterium]